MTSFLTPGVYVIEESRSKSIEGVSTSTAAFVGPTLKGPYEQTPPLLTSFGEFEQIYGGMENINGQPNYIAHAVKNYFDNGGLRLYVSRVVPINTTTEQPIAATAQSADLVADAVVAGGDARFIARFPGSGGNGEVTLLEQATPASETTLNNAPIGSILRVAGATPTYFSKETNTPELSDWENGAGTALAESNLASPLEILTLTVVARDRAGNEYSYENLGFSPTHPLFIGNVLASTPAQQSDALNNPFAITVTGVTGLQLREALLEGQTLPDNPSMTGRIVPVSGGTSGGDPGSRDYEAALGQLQALEDISIIAAPGYSAYTDATLRQAIQNALITYVSRPRAYQIAVLDAPRNADINGVRAARSQFDSKYVAFYYPWVVVANPLARPGDASRPKEIALPPSGFICGIYARNDAERGVYKAPANEVVLGALRFETDINFAQQGVLNPSGINCLRFFPGRGYRVWGARLASSDPEWKYVSDRRYFNYLEQSIDRGTQWAVFEPNGEGLWSKIVQSVKSFLYSEWFSGALFGSNPQEAFFVRCDRSTMTQNDLNNGRLICIIGVAIQKPAEFVIFRIGQKTADARE
ncbi:phage tail sheath family protein [Pantanalinema rosaneae CENA516]|uniref:phage tail sheath family protein n=1 Tax=Pantanalinema rosaneae TaxID=1620701 RepID=UPI003D6DEDD9